MSLLRRLGNVFRPERLSRDLDRELASHIADSVDDLIASGLSREEATREAHRRFGDFVRQKERTRDVDVLQWMESVVADVRYALRSLRSSPALFAVVVLSLGLGIGANTAIFSLIDAVMLRTLPVRAPEELVQLTLGGSDRGAVFTNPLWEEIRDRQDVFAGAFGVSQTQFNLADGGEVRNVNGYWVSGGFFETLGVRPEIGRLIGRADDVRGCGPVAVVSAALWASELGAPASLDGVQIRLNGTPFDVVGVVDADFHGVDVGWAPHVYAPLCARERIEGQGILDARTAWYIRTMARLRSDVPFDQANARLAALAPAVFGATIPPSFSARAQESYVRTPLSIEPASQGFSYIRRQYSTALRVLLGVVGLVLLIACANVANLLLARATSRRHELAVRIAIGAGRWRVVRQAFTESLVLALLGAAAGLLMARWGSALLVRMLEGPQNAVWLDLSLNPRMLVFNVAVAIGCGLIFGLVPAWRASRLMPRNAMRSSGSGHADTGRVTFGKILVVGQVGLSFALLVAAALLLGTFRNVLRVDSGFSPDGVLWVNADMLGTGFADAARATAKQEILERVRAIPGVRSAAAASITPISGSGWNGAIEVEGYEPADGDDAMVYYNAVSDGFLQALDIRLVAGRDFAQTDVAGSPRVALVSQAMARKFYGTISPLGRQFTSVQPNGERVAYTVVGVVENTKYWSLREEPLPVVFLSLAQENWSGRDINYLIRTAGDPGALRDAVGQAITSVHPAIAIRSTELDDQLAYSMARERLLATLAGFFGALALILSMIGLFGTMSYAVARRRTEIGVRLALGAAPNTIIGMIVREAGTLVLAGLAVGFALAHVGTRQLETFLFRVGRTDAATIGLAALALVVAAMVAAVLPARRAGRADPVTALRHN